MLPFGIPIRFDGTLNVADDLAAGVSSSYSARRLALRVSIVHSNVDCRSFHECTLYSDCFTRRTLAQAVHEGGWNPFEEPAGWQTLFTTPKLDGRLVFDDDVFLLNMSAQYWEPIVIPWPIGFTFEDGQFLETFEFTYFSTPFVIFGSPFGNSTETAPNATNATNATNSADAMPPASPPPAPPPPGGSASGPFASVEFESRNVLIPRVVSPSVPPNFPTPPPPPDPPPDNPASYFQGARKILPIGQSCDSVTEESISLLNEDMDGVGEERVEFCQSSTQNAEGDWNWDAFYECANDALWNPYYSTLCDCCRSRDGRATGEEGEHYGYNCLIQMPSLNGPEIDSGRCVSSLCREGDKQRLCPRFSERPLEFGDCSWLLSSSYCRPPSPPSPPPIPPVSPGECAPGMCEEKRATSFQANIASTIELPWLVRQLTNGAHAGGTRTVRMHMHMHVMTCTCAILHVHFWCCLPTPRRLV